MNTINKPGVETYYILIKDGEYKGHGSIQPEQVLSTMLEIIEYTDKDEWLVVLYDDYGIEVLEDEG